MTHIAARPVDPMCPAATTTAAASGVIHAPAPVTQMAVAGSRLGSVLVAIAGGTLHAARVGTRDLRQIGTSTPGTDVDSDPAIVATADGFAVAWNRTRGSSTSLVWARLRPDASIDGQEQVEALDEGRRGTAIAASERAFAVAFVTAGAVGVRVIGTAATATPPVLLPGSSGATSPALAWMAPSFLAGWTSPRDNHGAITTARLEPSSNEVHPLSAIQTASAAVRSTLVAGGDRIMLAWFEPGAAAATPPGDAGSAVVPVTSAPGVYTTAFESNGVRLVDPQLMSARALPAAPGIAWDGGSFAIAWVEPTDTGTRARWARLDSTGVRQGEGLDVHGSALPRATVPAVSMTWDGHAYVLVRASMAENDVSVHRFGSRGCDPR